MAQARSKKDEDKKEKEELALSDDEILEALAPLEKQHRALSQVKAVVDAYFAIKSEMAGVEKQRDEKQQLLEAENQKLEDTRKSVASAIIVLNAELEKKRDQLAAGLKKELSDLSAEIIKTRKATEDAKAELAKENENFQIRITEIGNEIRQREATGGKILDQLNEAIKQKSAEHDKVSKAFNDFTRRHGLATANPA